MTTMAAVLERKTSKTILAALGVAGFALFTALGAHIRLPLPFTPVPITLQTFSVILAGAVLGSRLGLSSQLLYVALGVAGLPVFAGNTIGWARLGGPTGGYLIGFVAASYLIGALLKGKKAPLIKIFLALLAGEIVLYSLGVIWLMYVVRCSLWAGLAMGLWPFVPGELIKLSAAAIAYFELNRRTT